MDSQKSYPLALWFDPKERVLQEYLKHLRAEAKTMRAYYGARQEMIEDRFNVITERDFPDNLKRIKELQAALRQRADPNGAGLADTQGSVDSNSINNSPQDIAERFLLKNAYRHAASRVHPDRGGTHEDFVLLNEAYRTGDLGSVQEFLLSYDGPILDQLGYWETEAQKPGVLWAKFKSTPRYLVVQFTVQGHHKKAALLAYNYLGLVEYRLFSELHQPAESHESPPTPTDNPVVSSNPNQKEASNGKT